MYRLLIVTHDPEAIEMLSNMQGWEKLGFKPPRLFQTVEEAAEGLKLLTEQLSKIDYQINYDIGNYIEEVSL